VGSGCGRCVVGPRSVVGESPRKAGGLDGGLDGRDPPCPDTHPDVRRTHIKPLDHTAQHEMPRPRPAFCLLELLDQRASRLRHVVRSDRLERHVSQSCTRSTMTAKAVAA
jgi:hypothetical protein